VNCSETLTEKIEIMIVKIISVAADF